MGDWATGEREGMEEGVGMEEDGVDGGGGGDGGGWSGWRRGRRRRRRLASSVVII